MKKLLSILISLTIAMILVSNASSLSNTTNPGEYMTVHVIVRDSGVTMTPSRAPRGTTAIFLVSNRSKTDRVFSVGDSNLTSQRGTGFSMKIAKNERKRVQLYLTYRGPLPSSVGDTGKSKVVGIFLVT